MPVWVYPKTMLLLVAMVPMKRMKIPEMPRLTAMYFLSPWMLKRGLSLALSRTAHLFTLCPELPLLTSSIPAVIDQLSSSLAAALSAAFLAALASSSSLRPGVRSQAMSQ